MPEDLLTSPKENGTKSTVFRVCENASSQNKYQTFQLIIFSFLTGVALYFTCSL